MKNKFLTNLFILATIFIAFTFFKETPVFAASQDFITDDGKIISGSSGNSVTELPSAQGYQNFQNNQILPQTRLNHDPESRMIIDDDERVKVLNTHSFPYSTITYIKSNSSPDKGTGVLISPDTVLTAAHNIYSQETNSWVDNISVFPGRNGEVGNYGSAKVVKKAVSLEWINNFNKDYDIALIRLDKPLGVNAGWMGLSTTVSQNMKLTSAGYPSNLFENDQPIMYLTTGNVLSWVTNKIFYNLDTTGGQSGSPIYNDNNQVVAIHTTANYGENNNYGTLINSAVLDWVTEDLQNTLSVYRSYNPNSGEHFYSQSASEAMGLEKSGWTYEGLSWYAPPNGDPVYRLYNPNNAGEHHYTINISEKDWLVKSGWKYECISWYSSIKKETSLYRLYNPNTKSGSHHYTTSTSERDWLVKSGWKYEGISWYGL